ncbi:MAG: hypothetical protein JRH17_01530 [Deltaproteobacteria bacterium]|nr:hypothetical protein [Deltaproteobacteria bacterium]
MRLSTTGRLTRSACVATIVALFLSVTVLAASAEENPKGFTIQYGNALEIERNDGQVKIKLGGRIQGDFASIHVSDFLNLAVPGEEGEGEGEGVEFRRARLYISGELFKRIIFKAQYDFTGNPTAFNDVYIGMKGLGPVGTVRVGHVKEPFGLEELNSSKYITFMERAIGTIFDSGRNFGLMANNHHLDSRLTWAIGIFAPTDDQGSFFSDETTFNATGRITGLPYYEEDGRKLLHLGAAMSFRYARDFTGRIRQRPEAHLAAFYLDTGDFQRDSATLIDVELGWVHGPLSLQGEYTHSWINRPAASTASLYAGYIQVSYFLTGEHRGYKKSGGRFTWAEVKKSLDPANGGWGAWQIAARYSGIDLRDSGLNGGVEKNVTVGINWHPFSNTRLMLNYVWADVDDSGDEDRSSFGITNASGHAHIIQARAQLEF